MNVCRVCGWDLRPGAHFCRTCDAGYAAAMRKAKLAYPRRRERFPLKPLVQLVPLEPDDERRVQ